MSTCCAQSLADDDLPGMALLEFLAEWETADGQWIDPVELDDPAVVPAVDAQPQAEVDDE